MKTVLLLIALWFGLCGSKPADIALNRAKVVGLWTGTYTINSRPDLSTGYAYNFSFKADGKIITDAVGSIGNLQISEGSWRLVGKNVVVADIICVSGSKGTIGTKQRLMGSIKNRKLEGTWENICPQDFNGSFSLKKVR